MPSRQFVVPYFDILFRNELFQKGIEFLEDLFIRYFIQFSTCLYSNLHTQKGNARSRNNQCFRIVAFTIFRNKVNPTLFVAPKRFLKTNKQFVKQRHTYSIDSLNVVLRQIGFELYFIGLQYSERQTTNNFLCFVLMFISAYCNYILVILYFNDSLIEMYLWLELLYKKFHHFIITTSWNYIIPHRFELGLHSRKFLDLCALYVAILIYHPLKSVLDLLILKFNRLGNNPLSQLVYTHILFKHQSLFLQILNKMIEHFIDLIVLHFSQHLSPFQQKTFCLVISRVVGNTQFLHEISDNMVWLIWIVHESSPLLNILAIKFIPEYSTSYPISTFHNDMFDVALSESVGSRQP